MVYRNLRIEVTRAEPPQRAMRREAASVCDRRGARLTS